MSPAVIAFLRAVEAGYAYEDRRERPYRTRVQNQGRYGKRAVHVPVLDFVKFQKLAYVDYRDPGTWFKPWRLTDKGREILES